MEQILHQGLSLAGVPAACVALYDSATGRFGATQTVGLSEAAARQRDFAGA